MYAGKVPIRTGCHIIGPTGSSFGIDTFERDSERCLFKGRPRLWQERAVAEKASLLDEKYDRFSLCLDDSGEVLADMFRLPPKWDGGRLVPCWELVWRSRRARKKAPLSGWKTREDSAAERRGCNLYINSQEQEGELLGLKAVDGGHQVASGSGNVDSGVQRATTSATASSGKLAMSPSSMLPQYYGEAGPEASNAQGAERPRRPPVLAPRKAATRMGRQQPTLGTIVCVFGGPESIYGPVTSSQSYAVKPTPLPAREGTSSGTRGVVVLKAGRGHRTARAMLASSESSKAAEPTNEQTRPPSTEPSRIAAPEDEHSSQKKDIDDVAAIAHIESLTRHYLDVPNADHGSASPERDRDLLTTAERAFIDARDDFTMQHHFIYINEARARETPPRAPLSSVLSINYHIGRGAWHFHSGPPDTVKLRAWGAEKYGLPLD